MSEPIEAAVKLHIVRIDGGTQPRAAISEATVAEYAEAMHEGKAFPPVDLFFDGVDYWLADGFHRYHAALRLCEEVIRATLHTGTQRDAVLFSVGVNDGHGLRRTNDDKRKAVTTLLQDDEWSRWSDSAIARKCGVNGTFVGDLRRGYRTRSGAKGASLSPGDSEIGAVSATRTYTTKHGTEATMNTSDIGKRRHDIPKSVESYESRKAAAVDGASSGVLKKLPRRSDAEIVASAMQAMDGILSVFAQVDPSQLVADPRAEQWRVTAANVIGVFRAFQKKLERKTA